MGTRIPASRLENFQIGYLKQLTLSVAQLLQSGRYPPPWPKFSMRSVKCSPRRWSISLFHTRSVPSHLKSTMKDYEVDRTEWSKFLRLFYSFSNIKTR